MNIDTLVKNFYSTEDEQEDLINEVMKLLMVEAKSRNITLSWDGIPDIPISEIPWSSVETVEGEGADIQGPERQQLMQFLDNIEGDDLEDKVKGLAAFYDADPSALIDKTQGMSAKEKISTALGYLTFFKTLTKIIAHFNASSAGFSFEAFLGVLLGGTQIPASGADTIADLVDQQGVPISLKLYTEGQLKVGGSFTDLVNDLRKYEQMQYVAVTKDLNDEKDEGRLDFYRFNFTLDNIATLMLNGGLHNPKRIQLPAGFVANPADFEDIEIPPPPKAEELVKLYHDRVKELGAKFPQDVLVSAVELVGLPEDTSRLKTPRRFGRDPLLGITGRPDNVNTIMLAYEMEVLPEEALELLKARGVDKKGKQRKPSAEWVRTYGETVILAVDIYNEVVVAAYNDVVKLTNRNIEARQELISRAGGDYLPPDKSVEAYNDAEGKYGMTPALRKKALLLSKGYVETEQFDFTEPRVKAIEELSQPYGALPAGQADVKLGSIEVGQDKVVTLLEKVSQIIGESVFLIFEDLKILTTNIESYFGTGLKDDTLAQTAIEASDSIGEKTQELKADEN